MKLFATRKRRRQVERTTKRAGGGLATLAVVAAAIIAPAVAVPSAVAASPTDAQTHAGARYGSGTGYWVGSGIASDGTVIWCALDSGKTASWEGSSAQWSEWRETNSVDGFTNASGQHFAGEQYNVLAYIVGTWGSTSDNNEARAVYRAIHIYTNAPENTSWKYNTADVAARADAMIAEAQAKAGTAVANAEFDGSPHRVSSDLATREENWALPDVSADSDVSSVTVTATINGPGVFAENGSQSLTYPANQSPTKTVTATGNGKYTVSVDANVPGGFSLKVADPLTAGAQVMMAAATGGQAKALHAQGDPHLANYDFTPKAASLSDTYHVGTEASDAKLVGQKLKDQIYTKVDTSDPEAGNVWAKRVVNGAVTPVDVIYDVDWYYSATALPQSETVPASATLFDSTTFTANGEGTYDVSSTKAADREGYYYPVVSVSKASQAQDVQTYIRSDWTAVFHDENEEEIIPWTPQVTTQVSGIADGKISDTLKVTGANPNRDLTVVSKLYLTDSAATEQGQDSAPADAQVVATVNTTVRGDGTYQTEAVDVPWSTIFAWANEKSQYAASGENPYDQADRLANLTWPNLYWQESIASTVDTTPWAGKHLVSSETYDLTRPEVTTQAVGTVGLPSTVHDTAIVTGDVPVGNASNPLETKLGFKLYKFDDTVSGSGSAQPVCENPEFVQNAFTITRNGAHQSASTELTDEGTYGWVETLQIVTTGEHTSASEVAKNTIDISIGDCGAPGETVVAQPGETPLIGTQATTDNAANNKVVPGTGAVVTDKVSYEHLIPGTEYKVTGQIVDSEGNPIDSVGETTFTPDTASGTVEVTFTITAEQAAAHAGGSLVVFEQLWDTTQLDRPVAVHEDLGDKDQTVTVEQPDVPQQPVEEKLAHTGAGIAGIAGGVALLGAGAAASLLARKKRNTETE